VRWLALALALLFALPASADETLVVAVASEDLARHVRAVRRGARRALGEAWGGDRTLDGSCDPSAPSCVVEVVSSSAATRLLVVRVVWARSACVPSRDAAGAIVGHRMLRTPSLALELYDATGALLAADTASLDGLDGVEDRAAHAVRALLAR
jgi:hypothetical protein